MPLTDDLIHDATRHGAEYALEQLGAGGPLPRRELQQLRREIIDLRADLTTAAKRALEPVVSAFGGADGPADEDAAMTALEHTRDLSDKLRDLVEIHKLERELTDTLALPDVPR